MDLVSLRTFIRLSAVIEDTNITNDQIATLINQGYHELSIIFPWPWLETTADFTVGADVRSYDLPTNFDYGIAMIDTDTDRAIQHVAAKDFFERHGQDSSTTSSAANFWTIYENKVYFTPVPSTATTAAYTLYYYKNITVLSGAGDEPAFHDAFHWALVEYAKWKLYDREEMFAQSERAFITWTRYLNEMLSWYASPVKKAPFIWGDGRTVRPFNNLTILDI